MTHPLLTDEAVWLLTDALGFDSENHEDVVRVRTALEAYHDHHEGERPCEACKGEGGWTGLHGSWNDCPTCNGEGTVPADRLVKLSEAHEAWTHGLQQAVLVARQAERQKVLEASVRAWQGDPPRCTDDCEGMANACVACVVNDIHARVRQKAIRDVVAEVRAEAQRAAWRSDEESQDLKALADHIERKFGVRS